MAKADQKRLKFVRALVAGKTQKQAAIAAGYSPRTADSQASQILKQPKVQALLKRLLNKADAKAIVTRERIQNELAVMAFADIKDYVTIGSEGEVTVKTFDAMPKGASRAIQSVEEVRRIMGSGEGDGKNVVLEVRTKLRHHDKLGSLKELAKLGGMYPEEGLGEAPAVKIVEVTKYREG